LQFAYDLISEKQQFVTDHTKITMKLFFILSGFLFLNLLLSCNMEKEDDFGPGEVWKPSSAELSNKKNIEEFDLSDAEFVGISRQISRFTNLKFLILRNNLLKGIPKESSELKKLLKLNLAKNRVSEFPQAILKMESLQELDLRYNKIKNIPNEIKELKNLHTVYLAGNDISTERKSELRDLMPKTKLIFGAKNKIR
jgi:Leucine-rich repeat (LRR) protein